VIDAHEFQTSSSHPSTASRPVAVDARATVNRSVRRGRNDERVLKVIKPNARSQIKLHVTTQNFPPDVPAVDGNAEGGPGLTATVGERAEAAPSARFRRHGASSRHRERCGNLMPPDNVT
jgi:hypothetical protein